MEAIDVLNGLRREYNKRQHDTYSTGETNIAAMCGESADALERTMCELTKETERANAAENEIARLRAELARERERANRATELIKWVDTKYGPKMPWEYWEKYREWRGKEDDK